MPLRLMLISATDPNGENLDWFVVADDVAAAEKLWLAKLDENGFDADGISQIREILPDVTGTPFDGPPRAIEWDTFAILA